MSGARGRIGLLGCADAAVLAALRAAPHELVAHAGGLARWLATDPDAAVAVGAAAALWCVALWLGIGLLAAAAGRLPGALGRLASRTCRIVLPRAVHRLIAGTIGMGVLLAPMAAGAATPAPSGPAAPTPTSAAGHDPLPAPSWPVTGAALPAPRWPSSVQATPAGGQRVTVRRGDSLWLVAARGLGPHPTPDRIAHAWPRWYAANRDVIGDDPALITPGQVLRAPAAPQEEEPA